MSRAVSVVVGAGLTLGVADLLCAWGLPRHAVVRSPWLLVPAVLGTLVMVGALLGAAVGVGGLTLGSALPARAGRWLRAPTRGEGVVAGVVAALAYLALTAGWLVAQPWSLLALLWTATALATAAIAAPVGVSGAGGWAALPARLRRPGRLLLVIALALLGATGFGLVQLRPDLRLSVLRLAPVAGALLEVGAGLSTRSPPSRNVPDPAPVAGAAEPAAPTGILPGRNVVLVTLESVRTDRTSLGGGARMSSPVLDLLASRAGSFTRAYAASPSPVASAYSLLTGRYPSQGRFSTAWLGADGGVHAGAGAEASGRRLPPVPAKDAAPRLAEVLSSAGYRSLLVAGSAWQLRGAGLRRGFSAVDDVAWQTRNQDGRGIVSDVLVRRAVRLLGRSQGQHLFLWLHLPDASPPFFFHGGTPYFGDSERDRYDGEVAFTDAQLGILLDEVERSGRIDDTIVVVAGTQGHSFAQGRAGGCGEDVLRVPLLFWVPGLAPRRIVVPVEHVDVAPTLLDLLGLPVPEGLAGQSLVPLLLGEADARRRPEVVAEDPPPAPGRRTLVSWPWKLVEDHGRGTLELYHLLLDPEERVNRVADSPLDVGSLRERLSAYGPAGPPPPIAHSSSLPTRPSGAM